MKLKGGYTGFYTHRFNEVERGLYWFHLVRPSVCPSVDRILSALYLQQYLPDPFHMCTSYQATSEGVSLVKFVSKFKNLKFWQILKICNFDFVFFWLGIQCESIEWVIIRQRGVSSERRHSSCSSFVTLAGSVWQVYGCCSLYINSICIWQMRKSQGAYETLWDWNLLWIFFFYIWLHSYDLQQ